MYKIPLGEVGFIAAQGLENYILHFCVMGLSCSTSYNSKSIKDRNVMLAVLKRLIKII